MRAFKKYITILILGTGLIGSYLIVKNSEPAINPIQKLSEQQIKQPDNKPLVNEPLIENLIQQTKNATQPNNLYDRNNLTQNLGKGIFEQIKSKNFLNQNNEGGLANINLISGDPVGDIFIENQIDFSLILDINDTELKISPDNSQEAKIKYLAAVREINKRNFGDFNKSYLEVVIDAFQKLEFSSAAHLVNIYKNLAGDYSNLNVPADWMAIHKNAIIFYKNSEIVYQAIANYPEDPIKAYLALEMIDGLIRSAEQTQEVFNKEIQQLLKI